jgi:hypothetical protein
LKNNSIPKGACGNITLSAKFEPFEYKIVFHVKDLERPLTFSNYGEYDPLNYNDQINFNDAAMQIKEELAFKYGEEKVRDIQVKGFSRTEDGKIEFNRIDSYSGLSENEKEIHLYAILEDKTYSIDYHLESYDGATLSKPIYTFKYMNERFALPTAKCPGYRFYGWEFDQSPKSDKCLFYSWKRMYTPMGLYEFALTVAKAANNDIEVWPHFFPNKIKVYVSPNGAGVYEEDYDDTDSDYTKYKNVSGKRPFGIVYYQGDLASDWYDDTMTRWFRPGYELIGFSKNPKAKSADEIFTELTVENVNNLATSGSGTVYCIWEKIDITIDIGGATLLDGEEVINDDFYDYDYSSFPITIPYGKGVVLPKASLEGYDFLGWKTVEYHLDKRFYKFTKKGEYITGVKAGTGYDVDIYPVFKRCKYNLSFNANGGTYNNKKSGCIKKNIDYSEDISSLVKGLNNKNVLRKGYKLLGFSLDPKGNTGIVLGADGKPIYKSHKLILNGKKNVTLYAIWKKIG